MAHCQNRARIERGQLHPDWLQPTGTKSAISDKIGLKGARIGLVCLLSAQQPSVPL